MSLVLAAMGVSLLIWLLIRRWIDKETDQWIDEYEQRFPGRCPVCAFDRHARQQGLPVKIGTHPCPEEKK